jgi:cytochrome P450
MPYAFYAKVRQEEPITFNPILNAYLVSRYDDIRFIASKPDLFSSKDAINVRSPAQFSPETLAELKKGYPLRVATVASDGARHTRLREPLQKAFSPTRVRSLEPSISKIVHKLIDRFINDKQAEMISQFAYLLPLEVILAILGIPLQDLETVKKQSDSLQMLITLPLPPEQQLECARQFVALQHYYAHLIEERRKNPGEDLISDLIRYGAAGEEPFTDTDLINQINGVVIAGHETTTHLLGNGLGLLLEEPTRWQTLSKYPEHIPLAIEEILRLRGPAHGFIRTATKQVTVGGQTMPEGTRFFIIYASGSRDESHFPQASDFQMQRQPNHHLAFGHGIHFCVGAPLARLQGRIAFEILTQRIPNMRLLPDQQFVYTFNIIGYGYKHLYTQWD